MPERSHDVEQAATAPQGKRAPAAKTQPEFEAYKAAMQLTDGAAAEKAAEEFASAPAEKAQKPAAMQSRGPARRTHVALSR